MAATLVGVAAERGAAMLRVVVQAGADPAAENALTGETALDICRARGDEEGLRVLKVSHGRVTEGDRATEGDRLVTNGGGAVAPRGGAARPHGWSWRVTDGDRRFTS